jgi:hypothetical protein
MADTRLDTALLLPRADAGWRLAAAETHRDDFSVIAARSGMTLEEYMELAARWLNAEVATSEVRIRMRIGPFEQFLATGSYLTQFSTTMTASAGAQHRALRMIVERTVLGVPGCRPADRPIYGYLSGSDESAQLQQYGEVVMRLDRSIRRRSTFMLGDSLDHAIHHFRVPSFVPQPVARPTTLALIPVDVLSATNLADAAPPYRYAEAQIFGGLTPFHVREAIYTLGMTPSPNAERLLSRYGVTWTSTPGSVP